MKTRVFIDGSSGTAGLRIRQRIAALYARSEALRLTGLRGQAAAKAGKEGGESSLVYLGAVSVVRITSTSFISGTGLK